MPEFKGQVMKGTNDITAETLFNHEEFWKDDVSKKLCKEDENTNMMGDQGQFCMMPTFSMCVLAAYQSDEEC